MLPCRASACVQVAAATTRPLLWNDSVGEATPSADQKTPTRARDLLPHGPRTPKPTRSHQCHLLILRVAAPQPLDDERRLGIERLRPLDVTHVSTLVERVGAREPEGVVAHRGLSVGIQHYVHSGDLSCRSLNLLVQLLERH